MSISFYSQKQIIIAGNTDTDERIIKTGFSPSKQSEIRYNRIGFLFVRQIIIVRNIMDSGVRKDRNRNTEIGFR